MRCGLAATTLLSKSQSVCEPVAPPAGESAHCSHMCLCSLACVEIDNVAGLEHRRCLGSNSCVASKRPQSSPHLQQHVSREATFLRS